MLQKGIVEEILDKYKIKVRIPKYHKLKSSTDGLSTNELPVSIICNMPGTHINYTINDVVLVAFENDELSKPVILGLLYRDASTDSQIAIPDIESRITRVENQVESIDLENLHTYIRYSNDNGKTFTSLFDKNTVTLESEKQGLYYVAKDIEINTSSNVVYWSIINNNNVDITETFTIETSIHNEEYDSDKPSKFVYTTQDKLIKMPPDLKKQNKLYLSFKMLKIGELDDYHIVLTTDKDLIGTTYGSYIGISVTSNNNAPTDLTAYSWMSTNDTSDFLVGSLNNLLVPRIERMEKSLYGFNYSSNNQLSDGTGLKDAFNVNNNEINIYTNKNTNINFNSKHSVYVDNATKSYVAEGVNLTLPNSSNMFTIVYRPDNHMSILYKGKK